ncbi:MAG: FAD-dependent oxidoreductase [Patescibacteria group bacterium]
MSTRQVVIVGGGFGGLGSLKALYQSFPKHLKIQVTLLDPADHQLYYPWVYQVASAGLTSTDPNFEAALTTLTTFDYSNWSGYKNTNHYREELVGIDQDRRTVLTASGRSFYFDTLLLAIGSTHQDFSIPGLTDNSIPLKNLEDALKIRTSLSKLVVRAQAGEQLTVAVIGAGPNGIEFITKLAHVLPHYLGANCLGSIKLQLLDPASTIGRFLSPKLSQNFETRLTQLKIDLLLGRRLVGFKNATGNFTLPNGHQEKISADLFIWSAGVKPWPITNTLGLALDERGRIKVNEHLQTSISGIFAVGDTAVVSWDGGISNPPTAQAAHSFSRIAGFNLTAYLLHRPLSSVPKKIIWSLICTTGGNYACGNLWGWSFSSRLGFSLRCLADLRYFLFSWSVFRALKIWLKGVRFFLIENKYGHS